MRLFEFTLEEEVGGNYLYHATGNPKSLLSSGYIKAAQGPQTATQAQTQLPTVSVTRDWNYASTASAPTGDETVNTHNVGRDAVIVLDRNAIETRYKTLGTSQSKNIAGLPHNDEVGISRFEKMRKMGKKYGTLNRGQGAVIYGKSKLGGEFEEAIPVKNGQLPLKGNMVGFWINPKGGFANDPELINHPMRLDMTGPNRFKKAAQQKPQVQPQQQQKPQQPQQQQATKPTAPAQPTNVRNP